MVPGWTLASLPAVLHILILGVLVVCDAIAQTLNRLPLKMEPKPTQFKPNGLVSLSWSATLSPRRSTEVSSLDLFVSLNMVEEVFRIAVWASKS